MDRATCWACSGPTAAIEAGGRLARGLPARPARGPVHDGWRQELGHRLQRLHRAIGAGPVSLWRPPCPRRWDARAAHRARRERVDAPSLEPVVGGDRGLPGERLQGGERQRLLGLQLDGACVLEERQLPLVGPDSADLPRRFAHAAHRLRVRASYYEAACSRSAHCFGVLAGPRLDLLPLRLHLLHQLGGELARRRLGLQGLLLARRLERLCVGLRQQQPQRPSEVLVAAAW